MDGLHRQLPDSVLGEPEEASAYGTLLPQAQRLAEPLGRRHVRRLPQGHVRPPDGGALKQALAGVSTAVLVDWSPHPVQRAGPEAP